MIDKEYELAKEERDRKDKQASMIIFPILFLTLVGCIAFIVLIG